MERDDAIGAFAVVVVEDAGLDVALDAVDEAAAVVAFAGALVDFFKAAVAVGLVVGGEAEPAAFDTVGGDGFTAPDPNVPELMIYTKRTSRLNFEH